MLISATLKSIAVLSRFFELVAEQYPVSATDAVAPLPGLSQRGVVSIAAFEQQPLTSFSFEQHAAGFASTEAVSSAEGPQQSTESPFFPFTSFAMSI